MFHKTTESMYFSNLFQFYRPGLMYENYEVMEHLFLYIELNLVPNIGSHFEDFQS